MGSSRWFVYLVLIFLLLAVTNNLSAKWPFINDFEPFSHEPSWVYLEAPNILIDDQDQFVLFWGAKIGHPLYPTFHQLYYRRFESRGLPLTDNVMVADSSRFAQFNMTFPGMNHSGKWVVASQLRWLCPEWPNCTQDLRAWFSDEDGDLSDTAHLMATEVDPTWANDLASAGVDDEGNSAIAWVNVGTITQDNTIWCQLFDPKGVPRSDTIRVLDNSCEIDSTLFDSDQPKVGMQPNGDFVVVFQATCDLCGERLWDVFMRLYSADGTPKTNVLCASCYDDTTQLFFHGGSYPEVAMEDNGEFAIAWRLYTSYGETKVSIRRFEADGVPKGDPIPVDSGMWRYDTAPYLASDSVGNLIVCWQRDLGMYSDVNVMAQRYDTAGHPVGTKFQINDGYFNADPFCTRVALNNNGLAGFFWAERDELGHDCGRVQLMDLEDVGIYIHADANNDRMVNVTDAVFLISYIFGGGQPPAHVCLGDADGNGMINISDAVTLIAYIFGGGSLSGECPK
jgi:hypothetical protein